MSVLTQLTVVQWLGLSAGIIFFLGPGMLLGEALRLRAYCDLTQRIILALAMSMAALTIALAALDLVALSLSPPIFGALLALCWLAYLWLNRPGQPRPTDSHVAASKLETGALWAIALLIAVVQLAVVRGVVAQPGSDGYHHTLIAQTIAERGALPKDLLPLTPLITFTYHYGYHAVVAALHWLSGAPILALTLIVAQLLKAGAALTAALLAEVTIGRRSAGIVTALLIGLVTVFPTYYVNWGRNTQLAGLLLLAALLAVLWLWSFRTADWGLVIAIAILATGTAFAHYRVTLMAVAGCGSVVLGAIASGYWPRAAVRRRLLQISAMGALALLFAAPWLWHVLVARSVGYPAPISQAGPGFFQLDRLGDLVLNFPTNWPVLAAAALALIWGIWRRLAGVLVMAVWLGILLVVALPGSAGEYMDPITVITSSFLPICVMIGVAAAEFMSRGESRPHWRTIAVGGLMLVSVVYGAPRIVNAAESGAAYVQPEDLTAAAWVSENVPEDALFMTNMFWFDFLPDFVIASDAGGWLPVLARRAAFVPPMIYPLERTAEPEYNKRLVALAHIATDMTSELALELLHREGITHVFIGQRGGSIDPAQLLASQDYALEYHEANTYVFRVLEK